MRVGLSLHIAGSWTGSPCSLHPREWTARNYIEIELFWCIAQNMPSLSARRDERRVARSPAPLAPHRQRSSCQRGWARPRLSSGVLRSRSRRMTRRRYVPVELQGQADDEALARTEGAFSVPVDPAHRPGSFPRHAVRATNSSVSCDKRSSQ